MPRCHVPPVQVAAQSVCCRLTGRMRPTAPPSPSAMSLCCLAFCTGIVFGAALHALLRAQVDFHVNDCSRLSSQFTIRNIRHSFHADMEWAGSSCAAGCCGMINDSQPVKAVKHALQTGP